MRCVSPVRAWRTDSGEVVFAERGKIAAALMLRCGRCIGCRISRVQDWSVRCMHEASRHEFNSFVTLTYDEDHLRSLSLNYRDFQLFMKRLRRTGRKARFFMCGEYGESGGRPHFHALLFGVFFPDRQIWRASTKAGEELYRSSELERLWPHGFSSIGAVTPATSSYVAGYCIKKQSAGSARYCLLDERTGELTAVVPEFGHMSLKPGIGADWYAKFGSDVRSKDSAVINGSRVPVPQYYDKLLDREDPDELEWIKYERYLMSSRYEADNAPSRLEAQAVCAEARLKARRRSL